jgi:hypothetical protein
MRPYNRQTDGPLPKGTVFLEGSPEGGAMWVGIVVEAERTKKFGPYNIINIAEVFGFEHESGSVYANEVRSTIETKAEFAIALNLLGFTPDQTYTKIPLLLK